MNTYGEKMSMRWDDMRWSIVHPVKMAWGQLSMGSIVWLPLYYCLCTYSNIIFCTELWVLGTIYLIPCVYSIKHINPSVNQRMCWNHIWKLADVYVIFFKEFCFYIRFVLFIDKNIFGLFQSQRSGQSAVAAQQNKEHR